MELLALGSNGASLSEAILMLALSDMYISVTLLLHFVLGSLSVLLQ